MRFAHKVRSWVRADVIAYGHFKMTHLPIVIDVPVPYNPTNSSSSSSVPPGSIYAHLLDRDQEGGRGSGRDGGGSERRNIASPALTSGTHNGAPNAVDTTPASAVQLMPAPSSVDSWNDCFWRSKKVAPEQIAATSS